MSIIENMTMVIPEQAKPEMKSTSDSSDSEDFSAFLKIIEHDFPIEFFIAGELAQLETFAIPSISKLLHHTKQYELEGVKRLDDTKATLYGIFLAPEGDKARETMIEHLNWVHSHYTISNDDNVYTLLRLFFYPIEWINSRAWRKLTSKEINIMTRELIKIGNAMHIELPSADFSKLDAWQRNYRKKHQRYDVTNQAVCDGTLKALTSHFPQWSRGIIPTVISALLNDTQLIKALGMNPARAGSKICVGTLLLIWKLLNKVYRPWKTRKFSQGWLATYYPSYGAINTKQVPCCSLGPRKLINHRNKTQGCPFH